MDHFELIADYVRAFSPPQNNPITSAGNNKNQEYTATEKGLRNLLGENNCFLNVVIQSFWHLKSFRELFDGFGCTENHASGENCIFCALQSVLLEYRFSEASVIPPTLLRKALATNYQAFQRFQVGKLADAAEALEAILESLHDRLHGKGIKSLTKKDSEPQHNCNTDSPCFCLAHTVFGLFCNSSISCTLCSNKTVLSNDSLFVIYTYVHSLREAFSKEPDLSFCGYMKRVTDSEVRICGNNGCTMPCSVKRTILQIPTVFSVGLVWERANSTAEEIGELLDIIHLKMDLSNVFQLSNSYIYRLKGFICYYGCHYNAFFLSPESNSWFFFDDSNVKSIGEYWSLVKEKCIRGKLQPFVLFYERDIEAEIAAVSETKIPAASSFDTQQPEKQQETTKELSPEVEAPKEQNDSQEMKEKTSDEALTEKVPQVVPENKDNEKENELTSQTASQEVKENSSHEAIAEPPPGNGDSEPNFGFVLINSNSSNSAPGSAEDIKDIVSSQIANVDETVDIPVKISTWFYRGEEQVFRLFRDSFVRLKKTVIPSSNEPNGVMIHETLVDPENERYSYADLKSVVVSGKYVTIQRASKTGSLPETLYFSSEQAKELLALIVQRSPPNSTLQYSVN